MKKVFEYLFAIRPQEFRLVQAFFLYYVCIGIFIIVGITVGDSLFLTHVTQQQVNVLYAWMHVSIAVVTILITAIYSRVIGAVNRITLLVGMQGVFLIALFGFRQIISSGVFQSRAWLYFGLIIWIRTCTRLLITLFFSFAGDYFTPHDAKRLYGYIVGGLAVGIMGAGVMIRPTVAWLGAANMLYVCIGFLAIGIGFSLFIHAIATPISRASGISNRGTKDVSAPASRTLPIYVRFTFLIVLLSMIGFVFVDFQLKVSAKAVYPNSTDLARFFGTYYTYVGVMQILFQFLAVKFLLRRFGVTNCLLMLPVLHTLMSILFYTTGYGLLTNQALLIIATANFFQDVLSGSLDRPARELLFLPLSAPLRMRAQAMAGGMMMPLGQGIGGLLVMSLIPFGMPISQYSTIVFFLAITWLLCLVLMRPQYRETLLTTLQSHQLDATALRELVQDANSDFVLEKLLLSHQEEMVSFVLDLLHDRPLGRLAIHIRQLAVGLNPELAAKAIALLGDEEDRGHLDTLVRARTSKAEAVRRAAVLAYCQIRKGQALEQVQQWVRSADQTIRQAAIIGAGKYCGTSGGDLIHPILEQMVASQLSEERLTVARILLDMRHPGYLPFARALLADADSTVRIAAVAICAAIPTAEFVEPLLHLYRSAEMRAPVLNALARLPEACIPYISDAIRDDLRDDLARELLLGVLASIGGVAACTALWQFFTGDYPLVMRVAAGKGLCRLNSNDDFWNVDDLDYEAVLTHLDHHIEVLLKGCQEIGQKDESVWQLLHDQARLEIECLFQLLAIKYSIRQLEKIRYNFFSASLMQRANALELLDDLLPRRIAPGILRLLDAFLDPASNEGAGLSEETAQQLMSQESWLKVVTRYHLHRRPSPALTGRLEDLSDASERRLYDLLERILALKQIPLFRDAPANDLVPLAAIARPVNLKEGEVLFCQGDEGDAMYVICRGFMRVQVDGIDILQRKVGEHIGEMALIERAPRSASCIAGEETELLKIADNEFHLLLQHQPEITFAMLRSLAERLRQISATTPLRSVPDEKSVASASSLEQPNNGHAPPPSDQFVEESLTDHEQAVYWLLERISFLKKVPLFTDIPENYLAPLAKIARPMTVAQGACLFAQGDHGDAMYVICQGSISVQVNGREINQVTSGDCLGEMAILDGAPRSASCIAQEETTLLQITDIDFETIIKSQNSVARAVLQTLAQRLRRHTVPPNPKKCLK